MVVGVITTFRRWASERVWPFDGRRVGCDSMATVHSVLSSNSRSNAYAPVTHFNSWHLTIHHWASNKRWYVQSKRRWRWRHVAARWTHTAVCGACVNTRVHHDATTVIPPRSNLCILHINGHSLSGFHHGLLPWRINEPIFMTIERFSSLEHVVMHRSDEKRHCSNSYSNSTFDNSNIMSIWRVIRPCDIKDIQLHASCIYCCFGGLNQYRSCRILTSHHRAGLL